MPGRTALVISHEAGSKPGLVGDRLVERGFDLDVHLVVPDRSAPSEFTPFPELDGYDLVLPMGSYWSVIDHDTIGAWIGEELDLLRRAHDGGVPVLGVCFGGQALAAGLGGEVRNAEVTEIGWYELDVVAGVPVPAGPWMEWHHDCFTPPPGADVLATTPNAVQLFRVGASVGTQFHPEISVALAAEWLQDAPDDYLHRYGVTREGILADIATHAEANRKQCADLVDWFLDDVAGLTP